MRFNKTRQLFAAFFMLILAACASNQMSAPVQLQANAAVEKLPAYQHANTSRVNDTGMRACTDNLGKELNCPASSFPGQDADTGRDALALIGKLDKMGGGKDGFDFSKLDHKGNVLAADAKSWDCVLDNVTGLIWETKKEGAGLHGKQHMLTWYNPDSKTNGGVAGVKNGKGAKCSIGSCDTYSYVNAVNEAGLCGAKDWRLPVLEELRSLLDYTVIGRWGSANPAIDKSYFPHTLAWGYWTSEPVVNDPGRVWCMGFDDRMTNKDDVEYVLPVRLVRYSNNQT